MIGVTRGAWVQMRAESYSRFWMDTSMAKHGYLDFVMDSVASFQKPRNAAELCRVSAGIRMYC